MVLFGKWNPDRLEKAIPTIHRKGCVGKTQHTLNNPAALPGGEGLGKNREKKPDYRREDKRSHRVGPKGKKNEEEADNSAKGCHKNN